MVPVGIAVRHGVGTAYCVQAPCCSHRAIDARRIAHCENKQLGAGWDQAGKLLAALPQHVVRDINPGQMGQRDQPVTEERAAAGGQIPVRQVDDGEALQGGAAVEL